jgi:hypothetical protein
VLDLYFGELDEVRRGCLIGDAIDWCRDEVEYEGNQRWEDQEECHLELLSYQSDTLIIYTQHRPRNAPKASIMRR